MGNTKLYIPTLEADGRFNDYRSGVWGDSYSWHFNRSWQDIKHVTIHHSVTNSTSDSKKDVDYIAEIHRKNGWGGIGYHFVITADGAVWYVGDISMARANVANMNESVIGVCLVGDFTKENPTDAQILSAHDLAKYFIEEMPQLDNLNDWENGLKGHQEFQSTACPGSSWKGATDSMYERIKNRIPYTPQPVPPPIIDWEKSYLELKEQTDNEIQELTDKLVTCMKGRIELELKLAEQDTECQLKINELEKKLKSAESTNPKLEDFSTSLLIKDLLRRLNESTLGKITKRS